MFVSKSWFCCCLASNQHPRALRTQSFSIIVQITHWFYWTDFLIPLLKSILGYTPPPTPMPIPQSPHGLIREFRAFDEILQRYALVESRSNVTRDWQRGSNSCSAFKAPWLAFSRSCSFFGAFTSRFGKSLTHISVEQADRGAVWSQTGGRWGWSGMEADGGVSGAARKVHKDGSVARSGAGKFFTVGFCGSGWAPRRWREKVSPLRWSGSWESCRRRRQETSR